MAFTDWFKPDGTPKEANLDDLRREERRLAIREDQATVRLERLLSEKDELYSRGSAAASVALRRVLARRYSSAAAEEALLEREILRIGKDLVIARLLQSLAEAGKKSGALGENLPDMQVAFEDEKVDEGAFREALAKALGHDPAAVLPAGPPGVPRAEAVYGSWTALDRGEFPDPGAARRALERGGDGAAPKKPAKK